MRKGCDGGKKRTKKKEKTDEYSGHYVIASSRPPERRPLERRTLAPIPSLTATISKKGLKLDLVHSLIRKICYLAADPIIQAVGPSPHTLIFLTRAFTELILNSMTSLAYQGCKVHKSWCINCYFFRQFLIWVLTSNLIQIRFCCCKNGKLLKLTD